jgi:hypothetical protein
MDMPMMDQENPAETMAEGGAEEPGEGLSVTIDKLPDGTFTVSPNPGEPEPAESLDAALQMAGQILSAGARPDEEGAMTGYAKGAPKQSGRMPMAKVFGE